MRLPKLKPGLIGAAAATVATILGVILRKRNRPKGPTKDAWGA